MAHRLAILPLRPALLPRPRLPPPPRPPPRTLARAQPSLTVGNDDEALTDDESSGEDTDETVVLTGDAQWYGDDDEEYDGLGDGVVDASYDADMGQERLDGATIDVRF